MGNWMRNKLETKNQKKKTMQKKNKLMEMKTEKRKDKLQWRETEKKANQLNKTEKIVQKLEGSNSIFLY